MVSSRARPFRSAIGPSGVNRSVSTPHGTTRIEERFTPTLARPETSAELVATTAVAPRPMAGSSLIRAADAASAFTAPGESSRRAAAWRSVMPSESNSCTTGMPRSRAAASAARPLVQRSACTMSGRSLCQWLRSGPLKAGTRLSRSASPGSSPAGPASMYLTWTPSCSWACSGRSGRFFSVYTVTWWPWLASLRVSSLSPMSSRSGPEPARG